MPGDNITDKMCNNIPSEDRDEFHQKLLLSRREREKRREKGEAEIEK